MRTESTARDEFIRAARWADRPSAWQEMLPGVKRRVLSHSPLGMMAHFRLDPDSVLPLHSHPHAQFGVFLEGGGEFRVGDLVWKMKKGDSYYIPPGVPHELRVGGGGAVVVDFFVPERQDYHEQIPDPEPD